MPLDFPNSPTTGTTWTGSNGVEYVWDGTKWVAAGVAGGTGAWLPLSGGTMTGALNLTATGATTTRSEQDRWADGLNVKDFGAVGDGVHNDTAAFNAAIGQAYNAKTNIVAIPSGKYLLDPLVVSPGVVLQGMVRGPMDPPVGGANFLTQPIGATLLINSYSATSFIQLNTSNALNDVIIYDPNQVAPTATAPVVKPPMVLMQSPSRMRGVTLVNAYIGISVLSGRCIVEDCYVGAYKTCVVVDQAADTTWFCNVWCGPFYDTAMGLFPWQNMDHWVVNNNGIAFSVFRADAMNMVNCGSFIKWCGIYIQDSTVSSPSWSYGWGVNINIDACIYGVIATSTNGPGWQFSNMQVLPIGGGAGAVTPIYLSAGGNAVPVVTWIGGTNGLTTDWSNPNCLVNAGSLTIKGVNNIQDTPFVHDGSFTTSGANLTLNLSSSTGSGSAVIGFNVSGVVATMMGLDTAGVFQIGGWSWGQKRLALDGSGNLTLAGHLTQVGVTDGSSAVAGQVGEFITASNTAGITLGSTVTANVTSISLTAGDWDVRGEVWVFPGAAAATLVEAAIGTTSATLPSPVAATSSRVMLSGSMTAPVSMDLGPCRINVAATTPVYLMATVAFASGTTTAQGAISARRVR